MTSHSFILSVPAILILLTGLTRGAGPVTVAGTASGPAAGAQRNVGLAWSPGAQRSLAVWDDKRPSSNGAEDIRGRLIGTVGDIVISAAAGDQKRPAAAGTTGGFLVFWEDRRNTGDPVGQRDIYAAKVNSAGVVTPAAGLPVSVESVDESDVEAESSAAGTLAVWERAGVTPGIMMTRTDPAGTFLEATPLRLTDGYDLEPNVAAGAGGFLVVWERYSGGGLSIMAMPVSWTAGGPVQKGVEFTVGPFVAEEAEPEVIWTGSHYLVTWAYRGSDQFPASIVGRRVNTDGTSPDPLPVTLVNSVSAKDRAMINRFGCIDLITMPEPATKSLQTQQVCYGGVIDVRAPVALTIPGVDRPEDPAVLAEGGGNGNVWIAWEDSRYSHSAADEDIYIKGFAAPATAPAALFSVSSEPPKIEDSPLLAGEWMAWKHRGGETAAGLIVNAISGGPSLWFPSFRPTWVPDQGGNRPGVFAIVNSAENMQVVLRFESDNVVASDWFSHITTCSPSGIGCGLFQGSMSFARSLTSPESIAGVSAEPGPIFTLTRPALASVVAYVGAVRECAVLAYYRNLQWQTFGLGFPPPSGLPEATDYHGTRIAAAGTSAAVAVWAGDNAQNGRDGRVWLRLIRADNSTVTPTSDWLDLGALAWNHGPQLAADSDGAVLFVQRPPGLTGWNAIRVRWDGTVEPERVASSLYSPSLAVSPHGAGFIGFQNLQGGTGGGEVRVTEWDRTMHPVQAWQWWSMVLGGDLFLQSDNRDVRLSGITGVRPGYGIWRPLRAEPAYWNPVTRSFTLTATGPAGMDVRVWHGPSPADMPGYANAVFESPGPATWSSGGPGTLTFQAAGLTSASRFFRVEAYGLLRVTP